MRRVRVREKLSQRVIESCDDRVPISEFHSGLGRFKCDVIETCRTIYMKKEQRIQTGAFL